MDISKLLIDATIYEAVALFSGSVWILFLFSLFGMSIGYALVELLIRFLKRPLRRLYRKVKKFIIRKISAIAVKRGI